MTREAHVALAHDPVKKLPAAVLLAVALMLGGLGASEFMKPTRVMADEMTPVDMTTMLPERFGDWREEKTGPAVITDPTVEATLKQFYSQTLSRTYVNSKGEIIMLSLAYGKNQNSWNTAAHRPEFCYRGQGFEVAERGTSPFQLTSHRIDAVRLVAQRGRQIEPISYWVTLHDTTAIPGVNRKLQQIRYGLQGMIVDGFLFRVSSLGSDEAQQYALHESFTRDMEQALPPALRPRLFGAQ
jgi:EpsI family protein